MMIDEELKKVMSDYFKEFPHEVREADFETYRERFEKAGLRSITYLKSIRTRLVKNGILEPTPAEIEKMKKAKAKRPKGTFLGAYLRTKAAAKNEINRNYH